MSEDYNHGLEAKINMDNWLQTLGTKDPEQVAVLYIEDATFLPTVSGDFKRGQDGAKDYFVHFLAKNPKGEVIDDVVTSINESSYLHSGMYNFELDSENGRVVVNARFTYLWLKDESGAWKISHHHSSMRPE